MKKDDRLPEKPKKGIVRDMEMSLLRNKLCFRCTTDRTTPVSGNRFKRYTACDAFVPCFRVIDMAADDTEHLLHCAPHRYC